MSKNYYSILGVSASATKAEIKAAYRKLAHKYHPDKNPDDTFSEQMFRDVKDAYETLSDDQKRGQYDNASRRQSSSKRESKQERARTYEPTPTQLVNRIIINLQQIADQTKDAVTSLVKTDVIIDYLDKVLTVDAINLYKAISEEQRRKLIFTIVPLLRFLRGYDQDEYANYLVNIVAPDNELIQEIHERLKSEKSKQTVTNIKGFVWSNPKLVGIAALFALIGLFGLFDNASFSGSDDYSYTPSSSRADVVDNEIDLRKLPEIDSLKRESGGSVFDAFFGGGKRPPSKWKGNGLKTGDSPYNVYFGAGLYDKQFQNRIKVLNGQGTDVIVCLTEYNGGKRTIRNEYIRAGESFEMTSIPNGTYYLKSFFGNDWNPDTMFMGRIPGFFETRTGFSKSDNYDDLFRLEQDYYQYSTYEVTLYPVVNGNMESTPINAQDFFK